MSSSLGNGLDNTHPLMRVLVIGLLDLDLGLRNWILGNGWSHVVDRSSYIK